MRWRVGERATWRGRRSRAHLDEELVAPRVERLKRPRHRHVKDEHAAVGAAVEGDTEALKALLAGRVPNLDARRGWGWGLLCSAAET